jgi:hypothetical protein
MRWVPRTTHTPFHIAHPRKSVQSSPDDLLLILPVLLFTLLAGNSVFSAGYQKDLTAAQSGDYATALREWTPLADLSAAQKLARECVHKKYKGC